MFCVNNHVYQYGWENDCWRSDLLPFWVVFAGREYSDEDALSYVEVLGYLVSFSQLLDLIAVVIFLLQLPKIG